MFIGIISDWYERMSSNKNIHNCNINDNDNPILISFITRMRYILINTFFLKKVKLFNTNSQRIDIIKNNIAGIILKAEKYHHKKGTTMYNVFLNIYEIDTIDTKEISYENLLVLIGNEDDTRTLTQYMNIYFIQYKSNIMNNDIQEDKSSMVLDTENNIELNKESTNIPNVFNNTMDNVKYIEKMEEKKTETI